jgi:hypothetical protein
MTTVEFSKTEQSHSYGHYTTDFQEYLTFLRHIEHIDGSQLDSLIQQSSNHVNTINSIYPITVYGWTIETDLMDTQNPIWITLKVDENHQLTFVGVSVTPPPSTNRSDFDCTTHYSNEEFVLRFDRLNMIC